MLKHKNFLIIYTTIFLLVIFSSTYLFNTKKYKKENQKDIKTLGYNDVHSLIYPVGSVYISVEDDTVAKVQARFGGTWVAFGSGKTLVGVNTSDGDFNTIEKTAGSKTVTLSTTNLPSHTHSIPVLSGTAQSAGDHTHTVTTTKKDNVAGTTSAGAHTHTVTTAAKNNVAGTTSAGSHAHDIALRIGGTTGAYYASPPTTAQNTGSSGTRGEVIKSAGAHTHNLNIPSLSGTAASNGAHTHNLNIPALSGTAASAGAHTHTVTTTASTSGATGSDTAFSIVQPYVTVYMYKRTA